MSVSADRVIGQGHELGYYRLDPLSNDTAIMDSASWKEPLSAEEKRKVMVELRRIHERPPPIDPSSAGCLTAIVALIAIVLMLFLGRGFDLSGDTMFALGIGLGVLAVSGVLLRFFGGGFVSGAIIDDVEEAIEQLVTEFPDGDEALIREATIRILDQSVISRGPTSIHSFERDEVANQLGKALEYVLRVERFLLEREVIYPAFTMLLEEDLDSLDDEEYVP